MTYDISLKEWDELERRLASELDPERYQHSLGVAYTAAALAMNYGRDVQQARLAGLLHDCAKNVPKELRIKTCEDAGIPLSRFERSNTALIHAKLGAYFARTKYGIEDEEVLGSICYHTTGRTGMTQLEQIIYISDYIEPNRDEELKDLKEVRLAAFEDLDRCCAMIAARTLDYLNKSEKEIDSTTQEVCEYYNNLITGENQ
jgi:predicted HD superfamily hydrolase involved in NAD metabolism